MLNLFRISMTLLGLLTLIGACRVVQAQEPERKAIIKFDAVTHYTDGTAIPAGKVISYQVYQGDCGGEKVLIGTITETGMTISSGLQRGGNYGWHVIAVVDGEPSDASNEACKAFRVPNAVVIIVE